MACETNWEAACYFTFAFTFSLARSLFHIHNCHFYFMLLAVSLSPFISLITLFVGTLGERRSSGHSVGARAGQSGGPERVVRRIRVSHSITTVVVWTRIPAGCGAGACLYALFLCIAFLSVCTAPVFGAIEYISVSRPCALHVLPRWRRWNVWIATWC